MVACWWGVRHAPSLSPKSARASIGRIAWASVLLATAAKSAMAGELSWGGTLGFGSDNVYRGISMTAGRPAWFADVHARSASDWVFGLSASAQRLPYQSEGAEIVLYAQRSWQFGQDWVIQAGFKHHESPWHAYPGRMRYDEATLGLDWRGRVQASLSYSPNTAGYFPGRYAERGGASWLELGFVQPIHGRLVAHLGLGRAQFSGADLADYAYASAGLRYGIGPAWLFVSWIRADVEGYYYRHWDLAGERWVASVAWTFP